MKLIVSQVAGSDLARLHAFLAHKNPAAADRAVAALISATQSLETFPERGRPSGTRDTYIAAQLSRVGRPLRPPLLLSARADRALLI
jgi:plasmid stabilization system protein ParE